MELSIIIVSFNTRNVTLACLASIDGDLLGDKDKVEVVLVDNNSTDDTQSSLDSSLYKNFDLKIIKNTQNLGFGIANNQGVKASSGEYVFFLNSDTLLRGRAIQRLLGCARANPEYGFFAPTLLNLDGSLQASVGRFFTPFWTFIYLFLKGDVLGLTKWAVTKSQRVDWASGAAIMCKKSIFEQLGGFDENIFMYMEEVDLQYRSYKLGKLTLTCPDSKITHLGGASSRKSFPIIQIFNGLSYFVNKHFGMFSRNLILNMLKLKAFVAILIGVAIGSKHLQDAYRQALKKIPR